MEKYIDKTPSEALARYWANCEWFNRTGFMKDLKKVVETGVEIIGDIPYKEYTFIGIGPGRGGIEHLNNTTVSFDGSGLDNPHEMNRMMNFLAHEYFHHYNVKRIRPFELGPLTIKNLTGPICYG